MSPIPNGDASGESCPTTNGHFQRSESQRGDIQSDDEGPDQPMDFYPEDGDDRDEPDYYGLLGLARNPAPNNTQITSAYRNRALSFHPDKQPPHLREAAEWQFNQIHSAYEILIDPHKRTVYDLLGVEGVQREWGSYGAVTKNQEMGIKAMAPAEFRRWFLKTMKDRERQAVNSLVQSRVRIIKSCLSHIYNFY